MKFLNGFFAPLLEPLGIIWLLMVLGVFRLSYRRQWRGVIWLGLPTFLIFLVGSTPFVDVLVAHAERPQAHANIQNVPIADAVIALGGDYCLSQNDPFGFSLRAGGNRLLTALNLVRLGKAKSLVLGGCEPCEGQPGVMAASLVEKWILTFGFPVAVTNLGFCANTHEEALHFKKIKAEKGWQKVILVTSALHMPRASAVFAAQGITTVTAACDFQVYGLPSRKGDLSPFPRQSRFDILFLYLHEKLGWWVYWTRGWI